MSTNMSYATRNNENNIDVFDFENNKKKLINIGNNSHLRDQISKYISECFIRSNKDETNLSSNISSMTNKDDIEKIKSLENQIIIEN